jgi:hypothetical protein
MIDWAGQAETIVTRLKASVAELNTVLHIKDAETESNPAILPAAYVIMARTGFDDAGAGGFDARCTWQVLVRCKQMSGLTGALLVTDMVLESLAGFRVEAGTKPLVPVSAEYFREEMRPEPAYVLTFTTTADQLPSANINC